MSQALTCIVIDDEPLAQIVIEKLIDKVPFLQLLKKCNNAIEALKNIQELQPDLIFLDVNMPEMTGLELVKIMGNSNIQVIITTAYPEFALKGYDLNVTDYLLKPISFERFFQSVKKANELISFKKEKSSSYNQSAGEASLLKDSVETKKYFWVKEDKKLIHINSDEVLLVEGMKDYIKIFLAEMVIITHMTMTKIENILPPSNFLRVNRSYLIRKSAIKAIHGNMIENVLGKEIIIGSTYKDAIRAEINDTMI